VTVHNFFGCKQTPDGSGQCAETNTGFAKNITQDEYVNLLVGNTALGDGPAICFPPSQVNEMQKELALACRELGNKCNYDHTPVLISFIFQGVQK